MADWLSDNGLLLGLAVLDGLAYAALVFMVGGPQDAFDTVKPFFSLMGKTIVRIGDNGMDLPPSLFADMGGALMASEAALKALLALKTSGKGSHHEVALSDAAAWLALVGAVVVKGIKRK